MSYLLALEAGVEETVVVGGVVVVVVGAAVDVVVVGACVVVGPVNISNHKQQISQEHHQ